MFCSNCGQPIEEGKAFCKACGAAMPAAKPTAGGQGWQPPTTPMPSTPPMREYPQLGRSSQPPQPFQQPPSPPGSRVPLVIGLIVAVIVVLAGAGAGVYFGVIRDRGEVTAANDLTTMSTGPTSSTGLPATSTGGSSVTTGGTSATTAAASTGGSQPGTTVQTIPSLGATTSGATTSGATTSNPTTTTEVSDQAYFDLTDQIVAELEADDARMPDLAARINSTAPKVPAAVSAELQKMLDALDADTEQLAALTVPADMQDPNDLLEQAIEHMGNRIYATIGGIEAMAQTGKVSSADDFFNQGRTERDAYQKAIDDYYAAIGTD